MTFPIYVAGKMRRARLMDPQSHPANAPRGFDFMKRALLAQR
jgi:hypothetical protein